MMDSGGHWYSTKGGTVESCHHLTLAQARKRDGVYGSFTTKLKLPSNAFLDGWRTKTAILTAEAKPRMMGESDKDFIDRINDALWGIRTRWDGVMFKSNDFGTAVHNELEQWNLDHEYQFAPEWEMYCRGWITVYEGIVRETVGAELMIADHTHKAAGTVDLVGLGHDDKYLCCDYKARGEFKQGRDPTYDKDCQQLVWQAWIIAKQYNLDYIPQCYSIIIDSVSGEYFTKKWTAAKMEKELEKALAINDCWNVLNGWGMTTALQEWHEMKGVIQSWG